MPRVPRYEFILTLYILWTIPPTHFNWQDWPQKWRTIFNAFKEYLGGPLSLWLSTWISCKNTKSLCRTKKNQRTCSWRYQLCVLSSSQNNSPGCPAVERERKPEKKTVIQSGKSPVAQESYRPQSTITVRDQTMSCCHHIQVTYSCQVNICGHLSASMLGVRRMVKYRPESGRR